MPAGAVAGGVLRQAERGTVARVVRTPLFAFASSLQHKRTLRTQWCGDWKALLEAQGQPLDEATSLMRRTSPKVRHVLFGPPPLLFSRSPVRAARVDAGHGVRGRANHWRLLARQGFLKGWPLAQLGSFVVARRNSMSSSALPTMSSPNLRPSECVQRLWQCVLTAQRQDSSAGTLCRACQERHS